MVNAIPNGDFEAGNDGSWDFVTTSGQAWSISNAGVPYKGSYEAINPPNATNARIIMHTGGAVTPGQSVTATAYVTTGSTSTPSALLLSLGLQWLESDDTTVISETNGPAGASKGGWTQFSVTGVAPAGAAFVKFFCHAASGTHSRDTAGLDNCAWNLETPVATTNLIFEAVQVGPGTSAATQPTWPTVAGNTVVDGTVTWQAVGSSIITWTGEPIQLSGSTEPIWPTTIGQLVPDNNFSWVAISRQITDPNLPELCCRRARRESHFRRQQRHRGVQRRG